MAIIKQNNISFTLSPNLLPGERSYSVNGKLYSAANNYVDLEDGDDISKLVNAVEIDWNGAEITSTAFPAMDRTINTTGDLLSWIKDGIEEAAVSGRISEMIRRSLWIN